MTKRAGVIGTPIGHSISPAVYNAAFKAAGIDATYEAWDTPADVLQGRLDSLRGADFLGANVTIPHKQSVIPYVDEMSETATNAGAINTIVHADGKLTGHNTDVAGFARSLEDDAGFDAKGKLCVILGSGGAARAGALALIERQASVVYVVGRKPSKVDAMVVSLKKQTSTGTTVTWAYWGDGSFITATSRADLIVNCTPIGMAGSDQAGKPAMDPALIQPKTLVFDMVYNPIDTPLTAAAKERGAKAISGVGMLVYQAAESFKLWTGKDADTNAMMAAARTALGA